MDIVRKYWLVAAAFFGGLILGLIFAWLVWPVEWTNATPAQLDPIYQEAYVKMTAELYSLNGNAAMVEQALGGWGGDVVALNSLAERGRENTRVRRMARPRWNCLFIQNLHG